MVGAESFFSLLGGYILVILFPIIVLYLLYLVIVRAFRYMGFSALEAILIVFVSYILGSGIIDAYVGVPFSDVPLFIYHDFWFVGINIGGAVIPILLSVYLAIKNKVSFFWVILGIGIISVITFFVTYPDPEKGIVSLFPFWLLPAVGASVLSVCFSWREKQKIAPLAYIYGTIGVLIGADVFHLFELLQFEVHSIRSAVIGGASVFDMVFVTGIIAVFLDSLLLIQQKRKRE